MEIFHSNVGAVISRIIILSCFFFTLSNCNPKLSKLGGAETRQEFTGFKLYKILPETKDQVWALKELFDNDQDLDLDFWSPPGLDSTEVMVAENQEASFQSFLNNFALNYSVVLQDIEKLVSQQFASMVQRRETDKPMNWGEYHWPETILSWLGGLASTRSGLYVNSSTIGLTVERRPITLVKISTGEKQKSGNAKRAVFIDGGIHAREWISSAVTTYILNELVHNSTKYERLLDRYDFHLIPLLNPDGYAHSCNYNRLWRKSRKANDIFFGLFGCRGVDLNRNFGFSWGGRGAGRQPCSLIYAGPQEFSEPESGAIRDYIYAEENKDIDWAAYFTLHSFGQKWLSPWGHTSELPEDFAELERVGKIGVEALRDVHGTRYSFGSTSNLLYTASGSSMDWFKGAVGVKYSYTLELRDYGLYGFLLPRSQIIPTAEETWEGIQAALLAIPEK